MRTKNTLLALLIVCAACSKSSVGPTPQSICYFYGDSITVGFAASSQGKRWTSVLSFLKGWSESNLGVDGETLEAIPGQPSGNDFFDQYKTIIPTKPTNGKYIFISFGANDCGINDAAYTPASFSTQLQTIITYANSIGWANKNIVVVCGYFLTPASFSFWNTNGNAAATMTRYNSFILAAQTVSQNNPGVYFVNPFNSYGASGLSADMVHPNDAGYAAIAGYVASLVP